jgi:hypothetical protein
MNKISEMDSRRVEKLKDSLVLQYHANYAWVFEQAILSIS